MQRFSFFILLLTGVFFLSCETTKVPGTHPETEKYLNYETVPNDPTNTRIYTLNNGLTVYLSKNTDKPRIQTYMAVRTGSRNDPADKTGLAHYLEHMVFKGTPRMGSLDWEQEKVYLQKISDHYESLGSTTDEVERKTIYRAIDSLSFIAAKFAAANEYDKLISSLGAQGTNAWTSLDETIYTNNIPSTELEKFLAIESERFKTLVLRLFHTELETVYEEFNRAQDNDFRKVYYAMMENLFLNHPYGTQTTLGKAEHLKSPSMETIHDYFDTYYRPNNCALVLVGDIDFDQTIKMVNKYYHDWEPDEVVKPTFPPEQPITEPRVATRFGPEAETVSISFRFPGYKSQDALKMQMLDMILDNGQAGLINLNLVQDQKVLRGGSYQSLFNDYSYHNLYGEPREGQTLEEVRDLLLEEIEKIKRGEFEDWLMPAVIKDMKLATLQQFENNRGIANAMIEAFIYEEEWGKYLNRIDEMAKLTKADIMNFAKANYSDNYVMVYKRNSESSDAIKLEKPQITPLELDRTSESEFAREIKAMPEKRLTPVYPNFETDITREELSTGVPFHYIKNPNNDLFTLYYVVDMGSYHDDELALAINYLPYLGTSKYSATDLSKEWFRLGLSFGVSAGTERSYVYLNGLEESMEEGIKLLEHILDDVVVNKDAYNNLVSDILKERELNKLDKGTILWSGMINYARYGKINPFTDVIPEAKLKGMNPEVLVEKIKTLTDYKHSVFYYGKSKELAKQHLNNLHIVKRTLKDIPAITKYPEAEFQKQEVFFVDYDMVQTQFILFGKGDKYDQTLTPYINLFNEYFGGGLSSIVFQEIRESKALAYSAFSGYTTPDDLDRSHFTYAFVGTQVDKLPEAMNAMYGLMNNMPRAELQFEAAKDAVKKKIESSRTTKSSIYWSYLAAKKLKQNEVNRKYIYEKVDEIDVSKLGTFFDEHIKGQPYKILVIGDKDAIDFKVLEKMGAVTELTLTELFGY